MVLDFLYFAKKIFIAVGCFQSGTADIQNNFLNVVWQENCTEENNVLAGPTCQTSRLLFMKLPAQRVVCRSLMIIACVLCAPGLLLNIFGMKCVLLFHLSQKTKETFTRWSAATWILSGKISRSLCLKFGNVNTEQFFLLQNSCCLWIRV